MMVEIQKSDEMGNVYVLQTPISYADLEVPVGFKSDGASVPRLFWRIVFPPGDTRAMKAAFLHDFVYRTHPAGWIKSEADKMFLQVLLKEGMPFFNAFLAYIGVKFFGGSSWRQ